MSGSSESLDILLRAVDQTGQVFAKVIDQYRQLSTTNEKAGQGAKKSEEQHAGLKKELLGLAAQYVTVRGAVDLVTNSLKAQAEQEAAINKLNLALANQGNFSEATSKSLTDYAAEMQRTTTYSDDAVIATQAMLASFGMNEEQIKKTTAVAADFAAATGTDLEPSAQLLAKAYAGNTAALGRYGIVVDENIPKSQKFTAVMEQLERRFSGSAAAATKTYAGQLKQLENAFGETQEGLGKLLGEMSGGQAPFSTLIDLANDFGAWLGQDCIMFLGEARAAFSEWIATVASGAAAFLDLASQIPGVGDRFNALRDQLDDFAAAQKISAEGFRDQGYAAAGSAGHLLKVTNATKTKADADRKSKEDLDKLKKAQEDYTKALVDGLKAHNESIAKSVDARITLLALTDSTMDATIDMGRLADSFERTGDVTGHTIEELEDFIAKQQAMAAAGGDNAYALEKMAAAQNELRERLIATGQAVDLGSGLWTRYRDVAEGAIEEVQKTEADAHAEHIKHLEELRGWVGVLADAFHAFGISAFDGLLQAAEGALQLKKALDEAGGSFADLTAAQKQQAVGAGIGVGVGAYKKGSVIGGAAAGAAFGSAFGPIGAGIGAVAGGLLGFFGGKNNAAKQQAEQLKQLREMQNELLKTYGSFSSLARIANSVGVDITKAFNAKTPAEFKAAVDKLNEALAQQKERLEGMHTAMEALAGRTHLWAEQMAEGGENTAKTQAQFDRFGVQAAAIFAGLVREGGDFIGALQQMGPSLDDLMKLQEEFGFKSSETLTRLLGWRDFIVQNEDAAKGIQLLNQEMKGLEQAGLLTGETLQAVAADATAQYEELKLKTNDADQALALMQPTLQELWEQQQDLGVQYDATTQDMLDQAKTQGLVGDQMRDVNEKILQVLLGIAKAIGADVPDALDTLDKKNETVFGNLKQRSEGLGSSYDYTFRDRTMRVTVKTKNETEGDPPNEDPPNTGNTESPNGGGGGYRQGMAWGGYTPWSPGGSPRLVGERTGEFTLSEDQLAGIMGKAMAMAGGSSAYSGGGAARVLQPVNMILNGNKLGQFVVDVTKEAFNDRRLRVPASLVTPKLQ